MNGIPDPARYEAWYHTPRGQWIAEREFTLLQQLLRPEAGASLLDVGCGSGYFSRHFAAAGLAVTGIDPDQQALEFARKQSRDVEYLQADALQLPFPDLAFDYTMAVTSLCFIDDPLQALREMWRVTRSAMVLGLLNRHSLLRVKKQGQGGYRGARWDTSSEVLQQWIPGLDPAPDKIELRSAIFLPDGSELAQRVERWLPGTLLQGGFLAVGLVK